MQHAADVRGSTVRVHLELTLGLAIRSNSNRKPWIEHYVHHRNSGEVVLLCSSLQGVVQMYKPTRRLRPAQQTREPIHLPEKRASPRRSVERVGRKAFVMMIIFWPFSAK